MCFSTVSQRGRFRFWFRFLENGSGGSCSAFGSWKTVPTVPVSGSGSVPGPPCFLRKAHFSKGKWIAQCGGHWEMDCPVRWSLATPSALESQSRANQGSVVANPICKCRRHKAGHLQVRVAVGRRSTCVLKEAPLNKGPLGFPHNLLK